MYAMSRNTMNPYADVYARTGVEDASPHRLIQMLMEGFIARVYAAKGCMEHGEIAMKGENITKAIAIAGGLDACLDLDKGGELGQNLHNLYEYIVNRLFLAHANNDAEILDETVSLMSEIKAGWDAIPEELRGGVR